MPATLAACQALPLPGRETVAWRAVLQQPEAWYGSAEAREVARTVLQYQTEAGGWPKNIDMTKPPAPDVRLDGPTLDNGATTTQLWLLGRVATAQPDPQMQAAVRQGIKYLFAAQYDNGGWPQYYPLRRGYYSHITYNDDAMVRVLEVVRAVARGEPPFEWVEPLVREQAMRSESRGIDCILRTQIRVAGRLTAWCAQHDAETLAPAPARAFEPVSLSGGETVGILRFLMGIHQPTTEVIAAIEAGVAWLEAVKLRGWSIGRPPLPDGRRDQVLVPDENGVVWARFYEIATNRPIFLGRDSIVRYDLAEVEAERRAGYSYYGTWGASLLQREYPAWRERQTLSARPY